MPVKPLKRTTGGKRKQNGKKVARGQTSKVKQKHEMESSPKEQISELEKEILSIKINEYESKLHRKNQLCSYLEEEINIYKTLYDEKQLLKSESMKLLNNAFEDFSTEIFLLDHELAAMQESYDQILKEKQFCCTYRKKVENLRLLEKQLEKELNEAEKCSENIPILVEKYEILQEKALKKREVYMNENQNIINAFEICLERIQEELNETADTIIDDYSLKLNLLPVPYKALFLNGLISNLWLESASNCYVFLQTQNVEFHRKYNEFLQITNKGEKKLKELFSLRNIFMKKDFVANEERTNTLPDIEKDEKGTASAEQEMSLMLFFERMCLHQQKKVGSIKTELETLENKIKSIEGSADTCMHNSYLVKVVCKAGKILREQF